MAQLNLSASNPTTVTWSLTGLSNNFNTTYYQAAYLSTGPSPNSMSPPAGILQTVSAPSSGTLKETDESSTTGGGAFSGGNSYTLYGSVRNASGSYSNVGSESVTMPLLLPSNLTGLNVTVAGNAPTTVDAHWNASTGSSGSSGYRWSYSGPNGSGNGAVSPLSATQKLNVSVPNAGTYQFTVIPYNANGDGQGQSVSFTVFPQPLPDQLTGLTVNVVGFAPNATVTATWNSSSNASAYSWSHNASSPNGNSGAVVATSKIITVSNAGTFTFVVAPYNDVGYGPGSSKAFTVQIPVPSQPVISSRVEGGFNVSWGVLSGVTHYEIAYKPSVNASWVSQIIISPSHTLSLGQWGLDYDIRVRASLDGTNFGSYSSTLVAITNPKTPTLAGSYNGESDTATLTAGGMSGSDSRFDRIYVEMILISTGAVHDNGFTTVNGGYVQFTPYTGAQIVQYRFRAYSRVTSSYGAGTAYSLAYSSIVTFTRPQNFSWTYRGINPPSPNGTIVAGSTKAQGYGFYVTAVEWSALCSRINQFRSYTGRSQIGFGSVNQGDACTATSFNQVRNAIAPMNSVGLPGIKASGDPITANDFNAIVACLNAIE